MNDSFNLNASFAFTGNYESSLFDNQFDGNLTGNFSICDDECCRYTEIYDTNQTGTVSKHEHRTLSKVHYGNQVSLREQTIS